MLLPKGEIAHLTQPTRRDLRICLRSRAKGLYPKRSKPGYAFEFACVRSLPVTTAQHDANHYAVFHNMCGHSSPSRNFALIGAGGRRLPKLLSRPALLCPRAARKAGSNYSLQQENSSHECAVQRLLVKRRYFSARIVISVRRGNRKVRDTRV